jgi:hypothetical protein
MSVDSFVERNARELERMRSLVGNLGDEDLSRPANEDWTIAGVLGHIAFWDARILALADKLDRGDQFTADDTEPEDVDWINDATRPLIHAVPPREMAELALRLAEECDDRVAGIASERMYPADPSSPIYAVRAEHRGEHLDQIDAALRAG